MSGDRRILIRLPNWVGDVVMALPAIETIAHTGLEPVCLGRGWAKDLLSGTGWTIETIPKGLWAARRCIAQLNISRGVLFTNSLGSALAARLGGTRCVGYAGEGRNLLLAQAPAKHTNVHEVEQFYRLARSALSYFIPEAEATPLPSHRLHLPLTDAHKQQAANALEQAGVKEPFIVCCPCATGTINGQSKVWPDWQTFAEKLHDSGYQMVTCPGPGEADSCRSLIPQATLLADLSLGAYSAIQANAQLTVANDSGPMHLAAASGKPVLGIFGLGDPERTAPWGGAYVGSASGWPNVDEALAAAQALFQQAL